MRMQGLGFGLMGLEAGRAVDIFVPVRGPDAVFGAGAGCPLEHAVVAGDADAGAERFEHAARV